MRADTPRAFLHGNLLEAEQTAAGAALMPAMRPPADFWNLLQAEWRLWPGTDTTSLVLHLLLAVYGLKGGPEMFVQMLTNWLIPAGWTQGRFDEQIFYFRASVEGWKKALRKLLGMI